MKDTLIGIGIALAAVLLGLLAFDHFVREIPFVRKNRKRIAAIASALGLAAIIAKLFKRKSNRQDTKTPVVAPQQFDDSDDRETDAKADNTDLDATATDRDIADLDRAADKRDDDLDELRSKLDDL